MARTILGLVLAAMLPFVVVELGLRLAGSEAPSDPYLAGFDATTPIFRIAGEQVEVVPRQRRTWRTEPFARHRERGGPRLFTVGDSVAWGHHGNEFAGPLAAFPDLLQALVDERLPGAGAEVLNVGARTFASGRVLRVAREILDFEPDAVVAYVGTSEHLEQKLREQAAWQRRGLAGWLGRLRLATTLRSWLSAATSGLTLDQLRERDPKLRAAFVAPDSVLAGEEAREALLERAARNLTALADDCAARHVPLFVATIPSNLRFPPFASRFDDDAARRDGEALIARTGALLDDGRAAEALPLLTAAVAAHPEVAGLHYRRAQALEAQGDTAGARAEYLAARDTDACPARAMGRFNQAVRALAREHPGVHLVDVERRFEAAVPDGIPDGRLFVDNCHPTAAAHGLIADEIYRAVESAGLFGAARPGSGPAGARP